MALLHPYRYSPQEFSALLEEAKARAAAERNAAIDAFWAAAWSVVRTAWRSTRQRVRGLVARRPRGRFAA